jgi:hypothetical protein
VALGLLAPEPSSLIPAVALAVVGTLVYLLLGSLLWPSVGGRALRMLLTRG